MDSSVIILDSSDDESETVKTNGTMKTNDISNNNNTEKPIKRIQPTRIPEHISVPVDPAFIGSDDWEKDMNDYLKEVEAGNNKLDGVNEDIPSTSEESKKESKKKKPPIPKNEVTPELAQLLAVCRAADSSPDMEKMIQTKLLKYYETIHPDYINSKSFKKCVRTAITEVTKEPTLVYMKISPLIEELNIRRKSRPAIVSTGNVKKDLHIKKLNKTLYILNRKIKKLEEAEVDLDEDENSAYLLVEKYKKRAFDIFKKICEITGEKDHAHRSIRKPIKYQGTSYPEFNKTIQKYINSHQEFPDYCDVYKCLEHCNRMYGYLMTRDDLRKVSEDAFRTIGKTLQGRRKADLYETAIYFTANQKDPAMNDLILSHKLDSNKKASDNRMQDIIDKYARIQDCLRNDGRGGTSSEEADDDEDIEIKNELDSNNDVSMVEPNEPSVSDVAAVETDEPQNQNGSAKQSPLNEPENDGLQENFKPIDIDMMDDEDLQMIS